MSDTPTPKGAAGAAPPPDEWLTEVAPKATDAQGPDTRQVQAPSASAAEEKPTRLVRLGEITTGLRTLGLNILALLAFLLVTPVIVSQFWRSTIMIEPISTPEALSATGLKPDVVANRLWDALQDFARSARTSKSSIVAIPDSQNVQFSFPDSGVSIDSLVVTVRRFFNLYDTHIGGEFLCADATCAPAGRRLRIRVMTDHAEVIDLPEVGTMSESDYFRDAAAGIYGLLDPFVAIAAQAVHDPLRATVLARRLVRAHHPDAKWALNLLGTIRINAQDPVGAQEEYRAALALDPGFETARSNLGLALRATGDLDAAKSAFAEIERTHAGSPLSAAGFAEVAIAAGDRVEALRQLGIAASRDPLNPRFLTQAGFIEAGAKHEDAAVKYFRGALEIDPGHSDAFSGLAALHLAKGDIAAAEQLYRDAADYAPDDADAQMQDARLLLMLKNHAGALARLDRATQLSPTNVRYRISRAQTLQHLGRHAEAIVELEAARTLDAKNADIFLALGDSFRGAGRIRDALAAYQRFLELDPKSAMAPAVTAIMQSLRR